MALKLEISIESCWRGEILDTVEKVAEFELFAHESIPGLFGLESGKEKPVTLTNKDLIFVWAAKTANGHYLFSISHNDKKIFSAQANSNIYVEAYLPDAKLYQFNLKD
ncbi:hypothetical protein ACK25U_12300 [Ectopseudomonas mendocina]